MMTFCTAYIENTNPRFLTAVSWYSCVKDFHFTLTTLNYVIHDSLFCFLQWFLFTLLLTTSMIFLGSNFGKQKDARTDRSVKFHSQFAGGWVQFGLDVKVCATVQEPSIQIQTGANIFQVSHNGRWIKSPVFRNCFEIVAKQGSNTFAMMHLYRDRADTLWLNCFDTMYLDLN